VVKPARDHHNARVSLVENLRRIAAASGASLEAVKDGRDRYGPVDAILFGDGYISVHHGCGDGYEVTVWRGDRIVAQGRTHDLDEIAGTLRDRQAGLPVPDLCRRHHYLAPADDERAGEALWHLLAAHGDEHLRPLVTAVEDVPVLRGLRPWVSHGTLHLLHHRDRVDDARYGLAFHPYRDDTFRLNVYDGPSGPPESLASVVDRAAEAARSWSDTI
jgi:hypothetical protein